MALFKNEAQRLREEIARLRKIYGEELKRKDVLIEELRKSNELLLRNAILQAEKKTDIQKYTQDLLDINKKLHEKLKEIH